MNKLTATLLAGAFLMATTTAGTVWSKGHTPAHKTQVCHNGQVLTIAAKALNAHLAKGDCQLPVCDFNNVFQTGDPCTVSNAGGQCTLTNSRDDACGVTDACPASASCY